MDIFSPGLIFSGMANSGSRQSGVNHAASSALPSNSKTIQATDNIGSEPISDLKAAIEQAINDSIVHKLFSAIARTEGNNINNDKQGKSVSNSSSQFAESLPSVLTAQEALNHQSGSTINIQEISSTSIFVGNTTSNAGSNFSLDLSFSVTNMSSAEFDISNLGDIVEMRTEQFTRFEFSLELRVENPEQGDPLILDLDYNGFQFSAVGEDIRFDLDANGSEESISRSVGADAFLAYDKNQDGKINNGLELFGDAGNSEDGFIDLSRYDSNNDKMIDAQDELFDQLLLLRFTGAGDQIISRLSDENIQSISLQTEQTNEDFGQDNTLIAISNFQDSSGNQGVIGDFLLGIRG